MIQLRGDRRDFLAGEVTDGVSQEAVIVSEPEVHGGIVTGGPKWGMGWVSTQREIQLGPLVQGGLAPAIMAIVERGVRKRPALANALRAEVQLDIHEGYPPVRIVFDEQVVIVSDGAASRPDLRVSGTLPDLIHLMVAPQFGGVPMPLGPRGRSALGLLALRRVRVQGPLRLMRQLMAIVRI